MPNTDYVAQGLDGEQIEAALTAINGVVTQENNGNVLAIEAGKIVAKSASEWTDTPVLEPLSVTANGDYTPEAGVDGYSAVHVAVPGGGGGTIEPLSVTQNGTYTAPSGVDGYSPVVVNVSGGGGSVVRVSTKSMGGTDASVDVYADELFVENVSFLDVSAGAYKDFEIVRVMYNTPASASPDGVRHTGWCAFALSACVSGGSTYTANQLIREWQYSQSNVCVAIS